MASPATGGIQRTGTRSITRLAIPSSIPLPRGSASGQKVTVNDLVLRACVRALVDEPSVNCRVHADNIEYPEHVNLGIAVGSDDGLGPDARS